MSGELQRVFGTTVTLEASGASIANNGIGVADDATYDLSDDSPADYMDAVFVLTCAFGAAVTSGTYINLVIRPLNIDGTTDAPVPTTGYTPHTFGTFSPTGSASQTLYLLARDIPRAGEVYLLNNATGQTLSAGWSLKMTPLSYKPAP